MNTHHPLGTESVCACGKAHISSLEACIIENGALRQLPDYVKKYNAKKAFLLADVNTYPLAGDNIRRALAEHGIDCTAYVFQDTHLEPDEHAVGSAVMHYDTAFDIVIALGAGVLNDIGKLLSRLAGTPYIIVATAPSMDGYASASSSMAMDGVKVTLPSGCPNVIIGDIDILKTAPLHMLKAGLGDMLAKYVSICEWRISHLITGEYYCEKIAAYIRSALKKCVDSAPGLLKREDESIKAVFEGLVACGSAMEYAGLSRPASGIEHYFSHAWDMRGLAFGAPVDLHGIQCAIGTRYALMAYEQIKAMAPDIEKGCAYAKGFSPEAWSRQLEDFIGPGARAMIALEEKEQKYNVLKHKERLQYIAAHWDDILQIICEELPSVQAFEEVLDSLEMPKTAAEIGLSEDLLPMTFKATKDIRDKYVLSRLAWDLGVIDDIAF